MCKMLICVLYLVYFSLVIVGTSPAVTTVTEPTSSSCREFQWQCRDGTCISFDAKCDGAVNCPDRSDETHALCRKKLCQPNWFRCTYGACVNGTAPCNGVTECADNSDELLPRCRNDTQKLGVQFKCQDGSLISILDYCDGFPDCPDGSDETVAACAGKTCPSYLFQCANGACVHQREDCNTIHHCAGGSDESHKLCKRIRTPVVKPTAAPPPKAGNCILPSYPNHGTYEVFNIPSARPGQSFENFLLTVSCQRGYGLLKPDGGTDGKDTQTVYCIGGVMYQNMPECVQFCRLDPDLSVRFMCQMLGINGFKACKYYVAPGTVVNPVCNTPNYYSSEILRNMKCMSGSWDYIAQCKAGSPKNRTNINIETKDKIEIHVTDFFHGSNNNNNKVSVNLGSSSSQNNNNNVYNLTNNNILKIYINNHRNSNGITASTVIPIDLFHVNGSNKNSNEVNVIIGSSAVNNNNDNKYNLTNNNILNIRITNNRHVNGIATTTVNPIRRLENGSSAD